MEVDHEHLEVEFDLVMKGSGSYALGDQLHPLKPGTLIWLMPGQRHRLVRSPGLEMWVATLRPEVIGAARMEELGARPLRQLPGEELVELDLLMGQVAQDSHEPAVYNAGLAYLAMRAWQASRNSPSALARPLHPAVARALLLLRQDDAVSLSGLAREAGVTATYLSRLLVEHTGRGFVEWRNRIRLDRFMAAYRPGANLLAAALEAGFGSYARFHHSFCEMIGCTPSEWGRQAAHPPGGAGPPSLPPAEYGIAAGDVLSARQHWTSLATLLVPPLRGLLGGALLARVIAEPAGRADAVPPQLDGFDAGLPPDERARLIAALGGGSPAAIGLDRLLATHDFTATFARVLGAFGLSPSCLADAVVALAVIVWVAATHAGDPPPGHVAAAASQVRAALSALPSRPDRRALQHVHTALLCQFVVIYHALESARASGSARAAEQLSEAAVLCGREALGADLAKVELGAQGFVRRPPASAAR